MKGTEFEFRNRFWIIGLIFALGFLAYNFDRVNIVVYLVNRMAGPDSPQGDHLARAFFAFAAFLILIGALIRTWAAAYLRSDVVEDPRLRHEAVVADGPYRHLRNPLYFGNEFLAIGLGFLASRLGFVMILAGMTLFVFRLIGLEESNLEHEQGRSYREFCHRVPRCWPSLIPRLPASDLQPRWLQAFLGELFMWAFFLGAAIFAITLNIKYAWIIMGAGLVLHILRGYILEARRKRTPPS
jgi:protein-S-isoprenylcysteine O-methyltransferase Ste14